MLPPPENTLAAFPPARTAGNVTLLPLTLGGAIRLAREGVDAGARVPREKVFAAAFVLSGEEDERRFLRRARCGLKELASAIEATLNDAFETWVKPPSPPRGATRHLTPHGLGWPLEIAEFLCGEYSWTWRDALDTPVATAYALMAANRQRHGGRHAGLDYAERQYRKDIKAGRAKALNPFDSGKEEAV